MITTSSALATGTRTPAMDWSRLRFKNRSWATSDESDRELFRSDGTADGTAPLFADINPFGSSFPGTVGVVDGALLFTADDGVAGSEPWILLTLCGDGRRNFGEECDDGNTVEDDDCSSSCELLERPRCAGDCDGDRHVTIEELVGGIDNALHGCPTDHAITARVSD